MTAKFCLPTILTIAVACIAASYAYTQRTPARGAGGGRGGAQNATQAIVQVKPGYTWLRAPGRTAWFVSQMRESLLWIRSNLGDAYYNGLMEQIRTVSDKPIKFAVVGDVHQDKSGSTTKFVEADV